MLMKLLEGMLYGVSMRDPLILLMAIAVLLGVSLGACYIPARRAMRIDPIVALRYE
jgi:putative ABC transport system permease protein